MGPAIESPAGGVGRAVTLCWLTLLTPLVVGRCELFGLARNELRGGGSFRFAGIVSKGL